MTRNHAFGSDHGDGPATDGPNPVGSLDQVAALAAAATRIETRCADGTLVWRIWGEPGGAPVVLLHGGSGSWTHWVRNIRALARAGRRVFVPDLPGFGESAGAGGTDIDTTPPWLEQGAQELLGDTALQVVGFSLGALVAALWAAAAPARIARLVLVGAPALTPERRAPVALRAWESLVPGPDREAAHRHNLRTLMLARDASVDALSVVLHAANVERDRLRSRRLMLTDLLGQTLPTLRCDVHGIWGTEDMLHRGRIDLVGPVLARAPRYRGLTLIEGAGHWVQYEDAAAFDAALAAALAA